MYAYEIIRFVSKLLDPLVSVDFRSLTPSQSRTLRQLTAELSISRLTSFPKLAIYKSDPRLGTILKIIEGFGVGCYSGYVLIQSVRHFLNHIGHLARTFGTPQIAAMLQKYPQAVDTCFLRDEVGIKMACLLSRAVGWPLFFLEPLGGVDSYCANSAQ